MTNLQVGQIVEITSEKCVRYRDYWIVTTSTDVFHIFDKKIVSLIRTSFKIIILSRINNNVYKAALNHINKSKKIREEVMRTYYHSKLNSQPKPIESELNNIIPFLEEIFISTNYPQGISLSDATDTVNIVHKYDLHCNDIFYLPVFSPIVGPLFGGSPNLYPDLSNTVTVYKIDNNDKFPLIFSGNIIHDSESKIATIYLHGFIDPYKWHFGVWKHYVSDREGFNSCNLNTSDSSCNIINNNCLAGNQGVFNYGGFATVHNKVKKSCQDYFNKFITHFENNTTKRIYITSEDTFACNFDMEILFASKITVFRGISYNFYLDNPVLHINPLTSHPINKKQYNGKTSKTVRDIRTLEGIKKL